MRFAGEKIFSYNSQLFTINISQVFRGFFKVNFCIDKLKVSITKIYLKHHTLNPVAGHVVTIGTCCLLTLTEEEFVEIWTHLKSIMFWNDLMAYSAKFKTVSQLLNKTNQKVAKIEIIFVDSKSIKIGGI